MNEIVKKYINRNYEIVIGDELCIKLIHNCESFNKYDFSDRISMVFGFNTNLIVNKWVTKKTEEVLGDIHHYYHKSYVRLNQTGWDFLTKDGVKINKNLLKQLFNGKYTDRFIDNYHDDLKEQLIIDACERVMGKMY